MKYVIWYLDDGNKAHKTAWGSDDLTKAKETVLDIRAVVRNGRRRFKKVWIAGESPGPMAYFPGDPEPDYSGDV